MAASTTAYDLVIRICPFWLNGRIPRSRNAKLEQVVYVDGVRVGGVEALRLISALDIKEIRLLRMGDVTLPAGYQTCALLVTTRQR